MHVLRVCLAGCQGCGTLDFNIFGARPGNAQCLLGLLHMYVLRVCMAGCQGCGTLDFNIFGARPGNAQCRGAAPKHRRP
jgi:hypothetical protein